MYRHRYVEEKLKDAAEFFKVVLVTGARQVGKTTLLKHVFPHVPIITFDPVRDVLDARVDPDAFLNNYPHRTILDEVQFVPELLSAIKRRVDLRDEPGQYLLTGSQHLSALRNISETMAGRVGIIELDNMSIYEEHEDSSNWVRVLLDDSSNLRERFMGILEGVNLYETIWRGSFPALIGQSASRVTLFHESYITTYVERDVRLVEDIHDQSRYGRFMGLLAALTAQEINHTELGRELDIAGKTAQKWLAIMHYTYQWREVWPYVGNVVKRVTKKRKGYMRDTGMACSLQNIGSHNTLLSHPLLGPLFETFCVNLIFKFLSSLPYKVGAYHWRAASGAEVDLLLEYNGTLYPMEFKHRTYLKKHDTRGLRAFREAYPKERVAPGVVIYAGDMCYWLDKDTLALPWNAIMSS